MIRENSKKPIRVAYGSVPKDGGTFTFYRNQRPALLREGVDLRCVTVGAQETRLIESSYVDAGCVCLAPNTLSRRKQAKAFFHWCEEQAIDIVMGVNSVAILSALPHLPQRIRVVSRCANGFEHGYRITLSARERLMAIFALTPRLQGALTSDYGVDPSLIELIPNGLDPAPFNTAAAQQRGDNVSLRLGFLGRLEHNQKGVMYLPQIVAALNEKSVQFKLRIAGKGRHENALRKALSEEVVAGHVEFVGAIDAAEVPKFLGQTDVFMFTSHFEGCPNALLEAMMAGAVPVSWRIEGTTDYLISSGETGHLCDMGDIASFSAHIAAFASDRVALKAMSATTARVSRERFSSSLAAARYARRFREVMLQPVVQWEPMPWTMFRTDPNFPESWRQWIPAPLYDAVRGLRSSKS